MLSTLFTSQWWLLAIIACLAIPCQALAQEEPVDVPNLEIELDMPEGFEDFTEGDFGAPEVSAAEEAAAAVLIFGLMAASACVALILSAIFAYLLMDAVSSVPEAHRKIAPWVPWLLFVPVANVVVLILAFIKVPESLSSYLDSIGKNSFGDCGKKIGIWGAILSLIGCTGLIGLVLLIISLMKINQAKRVARSAYLG